MEEPSSKRSTDRPDFSRGRLYVGLVLIAVAGAIAAYGLGRLRAGPGLGRLVYASEHAVYERDLKAETVRRLADLPSDTLDTSPSPDGHWLAYIRRKGDLWLLDLREDRRWQLSERLTAILGWTPDGRLVAHELLAERDLVAVDPDGRQPQLLLKGFPGGRIVWSGPDRFLWSGRGDLDVVRVGSKPSNTKVVADATALAVSPDGADALYVLDPQGRRPEVVVASNGDTKLTPKGVVFRGVAYEAAVSRQGYVALSGRDRHGDGGTWVLAGAARSPRRIVEGQAESLGWSLDGSALLYLVDGAVYAHDVRDNRTIRLTPHGRYAKAFAVV